MMDPARGIRLRSSARTNTGKVRDNNEDNIHLWTSDQTALAIVADGMGGAAAGEEASRIAVEMIQEGLIDATTGGKAELLVEEDDDSLTDRMKLAIRSANMSIVQKADRHPEFKGMGTTVTMALVRNTHAVIGHVGDSRAYLIDGQDGHIIQVTSDHSFVQALVSAGHISEEEAEDHPMKNVLYRALGQARDVEVDIYYERLHPNDRLVLCSDGLTLHVRPEEIAQVVLAADNPEEASQKLIELANVRGGRDNVSVIVIKVERAPITASTMIR
jgi:PPM family protein phosphatase